MAAFVPSTTFLPPSISRHSSRHAPLLSPVAPPSLRASMSAKPPSPAGRLLTGLRSALFTTFAVTAATALPAAHLARHFSARAAPAVAGGGGGLSASAQQHACRAARGAPVLRVVPGGVAMAPPPAVAATPAASAAPKAALAKAASKHQTQRFSIRARMSYALSEFLCWHPAARVLMLLLFGAVVVGVGAALFKKYDPEGTETDDSPFWMACRAYLNPLEDNWSTGPLRLLSVGIAAFGLTFFSIFVGMVTEAVESGIAAADSGHAQVVAKKHTLICGWNHHTPQIIANINSIAGGTKIVILVSEAERAPMIEELRDALSEDQQKRVSISVRSGTPILPHDLEKVAARTASKIILSAGRGVSAAESDRRILARALALRANVPLFSGDVDVVAELASVRDEKILQSIFQETNARTVQAVSSERLLFRFMAQAVRQVGLADCIGDLLDGKDVFHVVPVKKVAPGLVGMNYRNMRPTSIPGSVIAGYVSPSSGKVVISTPGSKDAYELTASTELLVVGLPSGKPSMKGSALPAESNQRRLPNDNRRTSAENILCCGWRPDTMKDFLSELDAVLPRGSSVTVVDADAPDTSSKTAPFSMNLKNISLSTVVKSPSSYDTLEALLTPRHKNFDRVLVLSSAMGGVADVQEYGGVEDDSKALTTLCYINDLLKQRKDGGAGTTVTIGKWPGLFLHKNNDERLPSYLLSLSISSSDQLTILHVCFL